MPSQQFAWKAALAALLLGVTFFATNIYFGRTGHSNLANMSFAFAVICDVAFVVCAVLWVAVKTWMSEPARPPTGPAAADKLPRPPQP